MRPVNPVPFTRFCPKNSEISLAIQPTESTAIKPTSVGILPPRFNRVTFRSGGAQHTTSWDRRASWKN